MAPSLRSRLSLRARITLAAAGIVTALLWGGGQLLVGDSRSALVRSLDAQVAGVAREVAGQLQGGAEPSTVFLRPGSGPFTPPAVQIETAGGEVVASVGPGLVLEFGRPGEGAGDAEPALALDSPTPPLLPPAAPRPPPVAGPGTPGWSTSVVTVTRAGPDLVVRAGSPHAVVEPVLAPLRDRLRLAVPLAGLAAAALAHLAVGRALRPVEAIRAEAEAVTATSLARRVPEPGTGDEIGRLAGTVNRMLDRLETAQASQRQFVSDASHELRSPLASLRSSIEVAAAHPDSTDWPATAADLGALTDRLSRLVDDLLTLARQGEVGPAAVVEDVDLDDLVREEVRLRPAASVTVVRLDPTRVAGSRRDLARVVSNLLDNAVRWASSGVEVSLRRSDQALLTVDDDGPGVPAADRERVFERFVRLDPARDRAGGGAGLGLAVVRETVAAHGGSVALTDSPAGGARVEVALPLGPAAPPPPG